MAERLCEVCEKNNRQVFPYRFKYGKTLSSTYKNLGTHKEYSQEYAIAGTYEMYICNACVEKYSRTAYLMLGIMVIAGIIMAIFHMPAHDFIISTIGENDFGTVLWIAYVLLFIGLGGTGLMGLWSTLNQSKVATGAELAISTKRTEMQENGFDVLLHDN